MTESVASRAAISQRRCAKTQARQGNTCSCEHVIWQGKVTVFHGFRPELHAIFSAGRLEEIDVVQSRGRHVTRYQGRGV